MKKIVRRTYLYTLIVSLLLSLAAGSSPQAAYAESTDFTMSSNVPVYEEDFEAYEVGDIPAEFAIDPYDWEVNVQEEGGGKTLKITKTGTGGSTPWIRPQMTGQRGIVTVSSKVMAGETNVPHFLVVGNQSGIAMQLSFHNDGRIKIDEGNNSFDDIDSYEAGQWYDLRMVFDTDRQMYDVYIDEVQVRADKPFRVSSDEINELRAGIWSGAAGVMYWDDIVITASSTAVSGIILDQEVLSLRMDESAELIASVVPAEAHNKNVLWSSNNLAVATVDQQGLVTGTGEGTAVITVTTADGSYAAQCIVTVAPRSVQAVYYVSPSGNDGNPGTEEAPFLTLDKARDAVRAINSSMDGDIVVYLRGGTYTLDEAFELDQRDSGSNGNRIVYAAYPNETPVISGGRIIAGWSMHDSEKGIYKAAAGDLLTRQLYVNGERATRARSTGGLPGATNDDIGHSTTMIEMAEWNNIKDVEFVYKQIWTQPRNLVESINLIDGKAEIVMQQPGYGYNRRKGMTSTQNPVWIENAYELLDEPGEWYLDRSENVIYYIPRLGENMDQVEVIAPVTEKLMAISGTLDTPVRNIMFQGITFAYAGWVQASLSVNEGGYGGYPDIQGNLLRLCESGMDLAICPQVVIPGHVTVHHAEHVTFDRNTFTKLGQAALDIMAGSRYIQVTGNKFDDISGSAVQIGEVDWADGSYQFDGGSNHTNQPYNTEHYNPDDERKIIRNIQVTNNYIQHIGVEYGSSVGVYAGFPQKLLIAYNEIGYVPYSGISVGWGWGRQEPSVARENRIINNYIHHVMTRLADGGGIYTLGIQPESVIQGNYIKDTGAAYGGIYLDEWTQYYTITDNVVETLGNNRRWLLLHRGQNNVLRNNFVDTAVMEEISGSNNVISNNAVISNGQWPQAALDIQRNAGIQAEYADILPPSATIEITGLDQIFFDSSVEFDVNFRNLQYFSNTDKYAFYLNGGKPLANTVIKYEGSLPNETTNEHGLAYLGESFKLSDRPELVSEAGVTLPIELQLPAASFDGPLKVGIAQVKADGSYVRLVEEAVQVTKLGTLKTVYEENFSLYEPGDVPVGWSFDPAMGTVTVQETAGQDGGSNDVVRAMKTEKGVVTDTSLFVRKYVPEASGTVVASIKMKAEQTNAAGYFKVLDSNGASITELNFHWDGYILLDHNGSQDRIIPYEVDRWYDIMLVMNTVSKQYSLLVDGKLMKSGISFRNGTDHLGEIVFGTFRGDTGSFYYDALKIQEEGNVPDTVPTWPNGSEVQYTFVGENQVDLSWNAAVHADGVKRYRVSWSEDNYVTVAGDVTTASINGLRSGTAYDFKVEASSIDDRWSTSGPSIRVTTKSPSVCYTCGGGGIMPGGGSPADGDSGGDGEQDDNQDNSGSEDGGDGDIEEPSSPIIEFTDVITGHWGEKAIKRAVELGIVNGYADGTFRPDGRVTRAEFAVMIGRALGLDGEEDSLPFLDEERIPSWARSYVVQALEAGIINGYADRSFRPDQRINRAEITAMIVRAIGIPESTANTELTFADADQIPSWARPYIVTAFEAGLIQGKGNHRFAPLDDASRAEAVTLILAILEFKQTSSNE